MKRKLSILLVVVLAFSLLLTACNHDEEDYDEAMDLFDDGKYEEARDIFAELDDYKDSDEMVEECDNAIDYEEAMKLFDDGEFEKAKKKFTALGDYKDSEERAAACDSTQIYGDWLYVCDLGDTMRQTFNTMFEMDLLGDDASFELEFLFHFGEDGSFSLKIDKDGLTKSMDSLLDALAEGLAEAVYQEGEAQGVDRDALDEEFQNEYQMSVLEYARAAMSEIDTETLFGDIPEVATGSFKTEGDKLFIIEDGEDFDSDSYQTFKLDGDKLTIDAGSGDEAGEIEDLEELGITLPLVLERQ